MTSVFTPVSPRKRSKNQVRLIDEEQEKISSIIHGFYEKTKAKLAKSLTKCENRNTLMCRQLFDSLSLHPQQELYETIRLHDLIFNEIDLIGEAVADFVRRIDSLQDKLRLQLANQYERATAKRQKEGGPENSIAVLRKVSFKREKHALKHRLAGLDTVNKKLLKCEVPYQEGQQLGGFLLDIEGKKAEPIILAYSRVWFESKRREYLLCLGTHQSKTQFYIFNDRLQTVAMFPHPSAAVGIQLAMVQVENFVYLIAPHQIYRMSLLNDQDSLCKHFANKIVGTQAYGGGLVLWAVDELIQHWVLFSDEKMGVYWQEGLKMNVEAVIGHFKLAEAVYFLTRSYAGVVELLRIEGCEVTPMSQLGPIEEVIPVRNGHSNHEAIFRMSGNRFMRFSSEGTVELGVEIQQGEAIRSCAVLGEHFYALSQNGKSILQCQYLTSNSL